ncbi:hypothetical protein ACTXT7_001153 [Hymenolepis weldensis]
MMQNELSKWDSVLDNPLVDDVAASAISFRMKWDYYWFSSSRSIPTPVKFGHGVYEMSLDEYRRSDVSLLEVYIDRYTTSGNSFGN